MSKKRTNRGFTIIELLIATAVFSLILVILVSSFIKISDMFYKGYNMSNTQETARTIIADVSGDIRFSKLAPSSGAGYYCIGQHRYRYFLGQQVGPGVPGLIKEDISAGGNCPNLGVPAINSTEMLDNRMQLNEFSIDGCPNKLCTIKLHLVFYGSDNTVLVSPSTNPLGYKAPDAICSGGITTSQYCATATYNTSILRSN